jgi:hypothetical protein
MNPIAWIILCHDDIGRIALLFRQLYRPQDRFVFHADRKAHPGLHDYLRQLAADYVNVETLMPRYCSWGGWSLVDATLNGIDAALATGPDWQHAALLSEHHLPLHSADEIAARLIPGVSWVEAHPVTTLAPSAAADVLHRFSARYRELPGVGMFPCTRITIPDAFANALHHGSQWVVLARDACRRLHDSRQSRFWELFQQSLLTDETALQTALFGTSIGHGLKILNQNATFVAWPHLSGTSDLSFSDANWQDARAGDWLFIRKRPAVLSELVVQDLDRMAAGKDIAVAPNATTTPREPMVGLAILVSERFPTLNVSLLDPRIIANAPICCLQIRDPVQLKDLFVTVASEDMQTWKVSLILRPPADLGFGPHRVGDQWAVPLKVRVHDMFEAWEILFDEGDHGFHTVHANQDFEIIIGLIVRAINRGLRIAAALPPVDDESAA